MMSKAKWFVVRKLSTGEIIAKSANQIVPPKFRGTLTLTLTISYCSGEGGSGDETRSLPVVVGKVYEHNIGNALNSAANL